MISFPGVGQFTICKTASHPLSHLILTATGNYYIHAADEETEAQRIQGYSTVSNRTQIQNEVFFSFLFFLWYWGLNSGPMPSATQPALFL
jgi:hypothetical protein